MAKEYKILNPEAVVNLITNPSIETATTGWTAVGGSIAQSAAYQRRGAYCLAVTPSAGTSDGVSSPIMAFSSGNSYTFSNDILGATSVPYRLHFATTAGVTAGTPVDFTANGRWERQSVTWACDTTANYMVYIRKNSHASTSLFYVDGALGWAGDHDTSYFDGDSVGFLEDGHYWNGTPHASTSARIAAERSGGQEVDLDTSGLKVSNPVGFGMPAVVHHTQGRALQPGAEYVGYKVMPRIVELVGAFPGEINDEDDTLEKRKDIINLIKPDLVKGAQPFILRHYLPNGRGPVCYKLVYDSGLEYNSGSPAEEVNIKCIAYDPLAYEDGQEGAAITTSLSVANADEVARKNAGTWANISTDFAAAVYALCRGNDGLIYLGGAFTNAGDANGDYIVKWNPTTAALASLSTGANNTVWALATSPAGNIYIGGAFTDLGGVSGDRIAYWDGSAFQPLSTGIGNGLVYTLVFGQDGTLYIGGTFTDHINANGDYITKWNGTAFSSMGTGMQSNVYVLAVHPNGDIYAGGDFTLAGGVSNTVSIARWDGSAWNALGTGLGAGAPPAICFAIAIDKNGKVYVGGSFNSANGVSCAAIACWNGQTFEPLGSGCNGAVRTLAFTDDGLLLVGGDFTTAGGLSTADGMAVWNGTTWAHLDANLPGTVSVYSILPYRDNLYFGYNTAGTATASYLNTLTNTGSTSAYPKFTFKRAGGTSATLEWIKNETTGATLWCNYALLDGESIVFDFSPGNKSITSSMFGNVLNRALLRNSDFADFALLPGANLVSVFVNPVGAPTVTAYASWDVAHWSMDGVAA